MTATLWPTASAAQGLFGSADWTLGRTTTGGGGSTTKNGTFTQTYTAGYRSALWDPRFMLYEGEVTFRRIGMNLDDDEGRLSDTGYRFGATLFNSRPFTLTVSSQRSFGVESGNLPMGSPLRGGLVLAPTGEIPELNTRTTSSIVNWRLETPKLPRIELLYRRGGSEMSSPGQTVSQRDRLVSANAWRKTGPLSNELRFQHTEFDNDFSTDFSQRFTELAYDGNAAFGQTVRTSTRLGYRNIFSMVETPGRISAGALDPFSPVRGAGESIVKYATQSVNWQPTRRLSTDATVSFDTSSAAVVSSRALLASGLVRYEVRHGLQLDVTGTTGTRTQMFVGNSVDALTRAVTAGASYAGGVPRLQFGAAARVGRGRNTSIDGHTGNTKLQDARGNVSTDVLRWVELGAIYENGRTTDDLLVFGNFAVERRRFTARSQVGSRGSIEAGWEHTTQEQGREPALYRTELWTRSIGGTYRLSPMHRLGFGAGTFRTVYLTSTETYRFGSVEYDGQLTRLLRASASFREEINRRPNVDQKGFLITGLLEYRVRLFSFGFEQRVTNIDYRAPNRDPFLYHGNSFLIRINRKFGWVL